MGSRRQLRIKNVLPVRVWGMDASGAPFVELAHTMDVSHSGVRLGGVQTQVAAGSVVNVQYHHRKAKFEVAWVGRPGSARATQIGVRCLETGKDLWNLELPDDEIDDSYQPPHPGKKFVEGRMHRRLNATAGVDYIVVGTQEGAWAELKDVSLGGCYLVTQEPAFVGTELEMLLELSESKVNVFGIVRSHHPHAGMGVEFTKFRTETDKRTLETKLTEIANAPFKPVKADLPPGDSPTVANRLQMITRELHDVEQLIISSRTAPEILHEFREAVGRVRNTSWALQRWTELQKNDESPFPVKSFLNTERIRLATRLCNTLLEDMRQQEIRTQKKHLDELLRSVEDLFTHLAGIDFCVLHPLTDEEVGPAPEESVKKKNRATGAD
jgi:hypothetical protein